MQIINGLVYAGLYGVAAYFIFSVNAIANSSSLPTRSILKRAILLAVVVPMVAGFLGGYLGASVGPKVAMYAPYAAIISTIFGIYLLTQGIRLAVDEARFRVPPENDDA
ncbi:MAG: hypothetical protein KAG82_09535 [Alcanivoracaceae bacterium]|nr:hypothetical protein [Alcanivoracaceae bacterium]